MATKTKTTTATTTARAQAHYNQVELIVRAPFHIQAAGCWLAAAAVVLLVVVVVVGRLWPAHCARLKQSRSLAQRTTLLDNNNNRPEE